MSPIDVANARRVNESRAMLLHLKAAELQISKRDHCIDPALRHVADTRAQLLLLEALTLEAATR